MCTVQTIAQSNKSIRLETRRRRDWCRQIWSLNTFLFHSNSEFSTYLDIFKMYFLELETYFIQYPAQWHNDQIVVPKYLVRSIYLNPCHAYPPCLPCIDLLYVVARVCWSLHHCTMKIFNSSPNTIYWRNLHALTLSIPIRPATKNCQGFSILAQVEVTSLNLPRQFFPLCNAVHRPPPSFPTVHSRWSRDVSAMMYCPSPGQTPETDTKRERPLECRQSHITLICTSSAI